jgi:hypothetical protein
MYVYGMEVLRQHLIYILLLSALFLFCFIFCICVVYCPLLFVFVVPFLLLATWLLALLVNKQELN